MLLKSSFDGGGSNQKARFITVNMWINNIVRFVSPYLFRGPTICSIYVYGHIIMELSDPSRIQQTSMIELG
jgi:hypothetical protein